MRCFLLLVGCGLLTATAVAAPRLDPRTSGPFKAVFGTWRVQFANGVVETCGFDTDGAANEHEPQRRANGHAERKDKAFVIKFDDDRIERWTPHGKRMIVEHWFPATQYPDGKPVVGNAERTP